MSILNEDTRAMKDLLSEGYKLYFGEEAGGRFINDIKEIRKEHNCSLEDAIVKLWEKWMST